MTPLPPPASDNNRASSTPLPPANSSAPTQTASASAPAPVVAPKPVKIVQPAPPVFPRYLYLSPRKPQAGDRRTASGAFTRAREFEQDSRWLDAMQSYRQATELDPGWFEAQYNYGVIAFRLRNFNQSLAAYEMALAIQPDSVDARYNFALALKAAGYVTDAVNELKKIRGGKSGRGARASGAGKSLRAAIARPGAGAAALFEGFGAGSAQSAGAGHSVLAFIESALMEVCRMKNSAQTVPRQRISPAAARFKRRLEPEIGMKPAII